MSEQAPRRDSALSNPQVVAAIIGGIVTVVVAVVSIIPAIITTQHETPIVVTATPPPVTTVALVLPDVLPSATPVVPTTEPAVPTSAQVQLTPIVFPSPTTETELPTPIFPPTAAAPETPPTQAAASNVLLMYDGASFTVLNQDTRSLSLEGVFFRSSAGEWEARRWGPGLYNRLPAGRCLRLRDASVGQRNPPAPCVNKIYGLQEVGTPAMFWRNVERFDVVRNEQVIASCVVADQQCSIYIS